MKRPSKVLSKSKTRLKPFQCTKRESITFTIPNKDREKDAENSKKNQMIQDHIKKTLTAKVEDLIEVFRKEYTNQRPYCNKVMVKVRKTELL